MGEGRKERGERRTENREGRRERGEVRSKKREEERGGE